MDVESQNERERDASNGNNHLNINNFHYSANDMTELRKIAEQDPELARLVVTQRDKSDQREHTSERIGLVVASTLGLATLAAIVSLIFYGGIFKLIVGVALIVVLSALVRVVLTGEWSDTSWTGQLLSKLSGLMGGLPPDEKSD